jgi:type IV secretion system protein VirB6
MGFFSTFWSWLAAQLSRYVGANTALLANTLEPTVVVLATLYVMVWGYLQMTGRIDEPVSAGIRRIVVLAVVLGVALRLWLYNSVIVDSFFSAPSELAAALVGASNPVSTIDAIWQQGGAVAEQFWDRGGVLSGDFGFYLAGAMVWILIGGLCVYTMFLIALSSIACAVLLAIGPLFIVMLLFDATRRLFEAWIGQLTNYALVTILTVLVAALLLRVVNSYASQTAARGSGLLTVDALDMMLMAVLVLLLMRQIMPIASGLAGGIALSSFGLVSRGLSWGVRAGVSGAVAAGGLAVDRAGRITPAERSTLDTIALGTEKTSWRDPV